MILEEGKTLLHVSIVVQLLCKSCATNISLCVELHNTNFFVIILFFTIIEALIK